MSVFQRILGTTSEITRNSERERLQRERRDRERADDAQDLRDRNVLHELDEANRLLHEQNSQLRHENEALRLRVVEQEQQAQSVLHRVADRSEAWRRTANQIRTGWGGLLSDMPPDEDAICDVFSAKLMEIEKDADWQHQRNAYVKESLGLGKLT